MASGMGTSFESDVIPASGEMEAQYKSSDTHGKQLVTEVSRMKVADWLVSAPTVCPTDGVSVWLTVWQSGWLANWLTDRPTYRLIDQ